MQLKSLGLRKNPQFYSLVVSARSEQPRNFRVPSDTIDVLRMRLLLMTNQLKRRRFSVAAFSLLPENPNAVVSRSCSAKNSFSALIIQHLIFYMFKFESRQVLLDPNFEFLLSIQNKAVLTFFER